jgi:hypothetical protein
MLIKVCPHTSIIFLSVLGIMQKVLNNIQVYEDLPLPVGKMVVQGIPVSMSKNYGFFFINAIDLKKLLTFMM